MLLHRSDFNILIELRSEKFEWFGPSPIEPFNPGVDEITYALIAAEYASCVADVARSSFDVVHTGASVLSPKSLAEALPGFFRKFWLYLRTRMNTNE